MGGGRGILRIDLLNFFSVLWRPIHMFFIFDYEIMNRLFFDNFLFPNFQVLGALGCPKWPPLTEKNSMEKLLFKFLFHHIP